MKPNPLELGRSSPEAQGVASSAIDNFLGAAERQGLELHSLMVLRHGQVIAEGWWSPYGAGRVQLLYSLTKSFTSTAVGLAVAEGRLSVDDPVAGFFPDQAPRHPGEHLAAMRVRHLLSMATGHREGESVLRRATERDADDWVRGFLSLPPDQAPGSLFSYSDGATFMLSAIVQRVTGEFLLDYLRPRLLEPLGIRDASLESNPRAIALGHRGLYLTTEAVARFGQLYLQRGRWAGRQLVPAAWVAEATSLHVSTSPPREAEPVDWAQGYGYQFWMCRHGAYRALGAFGQVCLVMPQQDAVVVITAAVTETQPILDLVWLHLLPAMRGAPLPARPAEHLALQERLQRLSLSPVGGARGAAVAGRVLGKTFHFGAFPTETVLERTLQLGALTLTHQDGRVVLEISNDGGVHRIECGHGAWSPNTTDLFGVENEALMVSGAWTAADTFTVKLYHIETPHALLLSLHFDDDTVRVAWKRNVTFEAPAPWAPSPTPHTPAALIGRVASSCAGW